MSLNSDQLHHSFFMIKFLFLSMWISYQLCLNFLPICKGPPMAKGVQSKYIVKFSGSCHFGKYLSVSIIFFRYSTFMLHHCVYLMVFGAKSEKCHHRQMRWNHFLTLISFRFVSISLNVHHSIINISFLCSFCNLGLFNISFHNFSSFSFLFLSHFRSQNNS